MRIVYVGRHDQTNSNDDEGAITHALLQLGHDVQRVRESSGRVAHKVEGDFMLCHHWYDMESLARVTIPKVYWCFDLIDWPERYGRHYLRTVWATEMAEICDLGFHTDGDWVAKDTTGKLYWLTQGADEREVPTYNATTMRFGPDDPNDPSAKFLNATIVEKPTDILFVGGVGYGRDKFVAEMRERYGERFKHILKGCYGAALADEINRAKIVVAPPTPVTDRYWSNRIYNVLRLGGFLLHPYAKGLEEQYGNLIEWYHTVDQLHRLISWALKLDPIAAQIGAEQGRILTMSHHTYRHRCEQLVATVKERLL